MALIKYHGDMLTLTGKECEEINAESVNDVIAAIKKSYGSKTAKAAKRMLIVVDGTGILLLDGYKTKLNDKNTLSFLPVCGGG